MDIDQDVRSTTHAFFVFPPVMALHVIIYHIFIILLINVALKLF